jgi:hypothetical protein
MLRGMTTRQFQEWRAYADLEPFDEERADLRAASIVAALVNGRRRKGQRAVTLQDCTLRFVEPVVTTPERAREQVRKTLDMLMLIHNGPGSKTEH